MASGGQKDIEDALHPDKTVGYTSVDLNATGTTTVYDPTGEGTVHGVYLENGGSTAVVQLELTDGTNTAVLTPGQTAGDGISFGDDLAVESDELLQVNVTTAEGSALSETAVVSRGEPRT